MAVKFFTGVDLCNKELSRAKLQLLSASPTEYGEGLLYYNNATSGNLSRRAVIRTNNAWKALAYVSDLDNYAPASAVSSLLDEVNGIKDSLASYTPLASHNSLSTKVDGIDGRLEDIEVYFSTASDSDNLINKWHEIVNFLNATEGDTLASMLSTYAKAADLNALSERVATAEGTLATVYNWYNSVGKHFKYNSSKAAWYLEGDFYTTGENSASGIGTEIGSGGSGGVGDVSYDSIVDALGFVPAKASDVSTIKGYFVGEKAANADKLDGLDATDFAKATDLSSLDGRVTALEGKAVDYTPTQKKVFSITANGSTTQTFAHNLGTRDVIVQLFTPSTPWEQVYADVRVTSINQVAIAFAEAPTAAYKVVIVG